MRHPTVPTAWLAGGMAVLACGRPAATGLVVEIDSDLAVPGEIDRLSVEVSSLGVIAYQREAALGRRPGEVALPTRLGLVPEGGGQAPLTVRVAVRHGPTEVVSRKVTVTFLRAEVLLLRIELLRECAGRSCAGALTCVPGRGCVDASLDPASLPTHDRRRDAALPLEVGSSEAASDVPDAAPDVPPPEALPLDAPPDTKGPEAPSELAPEPAIDAPPPDAPLDAPLEAPPLDAPLDATPPDAPLPDAPLPDAPLPDAPPPDAPTDPPPEPPLDPPPLDAPPDASADAAAGACKALEVAAGGDHACARKADGTVWCWGENGSGQLGDGTTMMRLTPAPVTSLGASVAEIAAGLSHTCARKTDGTLWCWGDNSYGELGDGTTTPRTLPVQVTALGTSVAGIWRGYSHTCARKTDGTLWCWGLNSHGQLGDGTTTNQPLPVQVTPLGTSAAGVAGGRYFTCARKVDGTLWCWGENASGQLGDGTTDERTLPVQVTALGTAVAEVSAGSWHTCARRTDGTLWCWGENVAGQLGDGTLVPKSTPVYVTAFDDLATLVGLGASFSCARRVDGTLWCWGRNLYGQVGDGTTTMRTMPVPVTTLAASFGKVAGGLSHACTIASDDAVWCWGYNLLGNLGDGTLMHSKVPVAVKGCP